jgi:hypothetical protein
LAAIVAGSCASQSQLPQPYQPGYAEYVLSAKSHDQDAHEDARIADAADAARSSEDTYVCPDLVLNDQLTGGFGVPLTTFQPCFDVAEEAAEQHRALAAEEAAAARRDRMFASRLARAEGDACDGIPEAERTHSVFAHRKEIARVIPHYDAGQLHGVWVVFKPVAGMTAEWVQRDIACQQARSAAYGGRVPGELSDPTLVPEARIQVVQRGDHVDVLVSTATTVDAEVALARANSMLHAQTAAR